MSERLIRRYANRKMYDVESSHYVSLSDLAEMIRAGESIRVTNKNGDKDYTAKVLQQIILDQTRESEKASVSTLHEWVRIGGSYLDQQLDEFMSGMDGWIRDRTTRLFKGLNRGDFNRLKKKVNELEKKVNELEKENS